MVMFLLIQIVLQVIVHCTTRTIDGIIVNSTRREHGGDYQLLFTFQLF